MYAVSPKLFGYVEPFLFATGLILWGIPHGAIDHLLEGHTIRSYPGIRFISLYLIAMIACFLLWILSPVLALLFFLAYSAWHFGESDMKEWFPAYKGRINNWIWGGLLLGSILLTHWGATLGILTNLGVHAPALSEMSASTAGYLLLATSMIWGLKQKSANMTLSTLMLVVSAFLPLITAFGLYFIGQHSLISWNHLKTRLNRTNRYLFNKALPFTAGAFIIFILFLLFSNSIWSGDEIYQEMTKTFFLFISCISFPHVIVMHRFYGRADFPQKK
jgi:Brp/Blh family beta-carotene 15,15'-monooxygenase